MHQDRLTEDETRTVGARARLAGARELAQMLVRSRADTLETFACLEDALPGLRVPVREELNPPLWELGHVGWFQEFWIARNPQRLLGLQADPEVARRPGCVPEGDAWYHSSRVEHRDRWSLPLPGADATRAALERQLEGTLESLSGLERHRSGCDRALYFHRLCLLHEDMHHEAALYIAQGLGIALPDDRWRPVRLPRPGRAIEFSSGRWTLGSTSAQGFEFDNEVGQLTVDMPDFSIDPQVVRWAEFLPFIEAGGYGEPRWWSPAGRNWLARTKACAPRYLRRQSGNWLECRYGRWGELDPAHPASHLSYFEAEAWCRWAGRRLPTEAQWAMSEQLGGEAFRWGDVWEWTSSAFCPFPGFEPHPYRDYSAPWFDGRPVLRGASFMTQDRMRHPAYRNYFGAHRNDLPAGFRSCAP